MATVYIVQNVSGKNFQPAEKFGPIVYIVDSKQQIFKFWRNALQQVKTVLQDFGPDDYLIPSGDPAAIALCAVIATKNAGGLLRVLKWDRYQQQYYPIELDFNQIRKENEDDCEGKLRTEEQDAQSGQAQDRKDHGAGPGSKAQGARDSGVGGRFERSQRGSEDAATTDYPRRDD